MGEPTRKSLTVEDGVRFGCGLVLFKYLLGFFALLGLLVLGICANQTGETAETTTPAKSLTTRAAEMKAATPPASVCGSELVSPPPGVGKTEWRLHGCQTREEAGKRWKRCLRRAAYSSDDGKGCPGNTRCCPAK